MGIGLVLSNCKWQTRIEMVRKPLYIILVYLNPKYNIRSYNTLRFTNRMIPNTKVWGYHKQGASRY